MSRQLLAIVTDDLGGSESIDQIRHDGDGLEVRVVVPAVEANAFRHTLGDVDEPRRQAEERLGACLDSLRRAGLEASGEVGDPDPVQAAQDALLKAPADEVVIFEHEADQARWYEKGLFEHARESLEPRLRVVLLHTGDSDGDHVVGVEEAGPGTIDPSADKEIGSAYLPGLSRGDFASIVAGITGTIVAAVLAAAAATGAGSLSGWEAAAILIAIGVALVNLAHVVGLTLFESVQYKGGFAKLFRTLSLVGTPAAVITNLLILLFA
ncbi:MAG: hypothetical protein WD810_05995 [Solirubrobacterales bacterium]